MDDSDDDQVDDTCDVCPSIDDMLSAPSCIVPVPAVDGWALIVLALSLLTLQKIRGANHAETARR